MPTNREKSKVKVAASYSAIRGKVEESEHLQFSEAISSLSVYTHHSVCSLWEHKSASRKKRRRENQM